MRSGVIFRGQPPAEQERPRHITADPVFAGEIREHLLRSPRQLPARYFYDALGSALFDAICLLPWYRITRAERTLLAHHAGEMLSGLSAPIAIAELGCGNGEKLATLLSASSVSVARVQLIDISPSALEATRRRLERCDVGDVIPIRAGYYDALHHLRHGYGSGALAVLFLGSNIGNFDPAEAAGLLRELRAVLCPGDVLILGTDLVKPEPDLLLAYDDPLQVTAAFNRNILRRINDELGGTFDLDAFAHRAVWNADDRRVEMHLVSVRRQRAEVAACGLELEFEAGERVWTESSYKYEPEEVACVGLEAGFAAPRQWLDGDARFAITRFEVPA